MPKGSVRCKGVGADIGDGFLACNGFRSFAKNGERRQTVPKRDSPQKPTETPPTSRRRLFGLKSKVDMN